MDIVSDTYIRGGIPQSRYCRSCAHYQVLSGCSSGSNCTADSEKRTTRDLFHNICPPNIRAFRSRLLFSCFPWVRHYCIPVGKPLRPQAGKIEVNCLDMFLPQCKIWAQKSPGCRCTSGFWGILCFFGN